LVHLDPAATIGLTELRHGDRECAEDFKLLGGYFWFEPANAALLAGLLPALVHIRRGDPTAKRLTGLIDLIADEALGQRPGRDLIVVERLIEVMLVETLRFSRTRSRLSPDRACSMAWQIPAWREHCGASTPTWRTTGPLQSLRARRVFRARLSAIASRRGLEWRRWSTSFSGAWPWRRISCYTRVHPWSKWPPPSGMSPPARSAPPSASRWANRQVILLELLPSRLTLGSDKRPACRAL